MTIECASQRRLPEFIALLAALLLIQGCASLVSSVTQPLAENLTNTVLDSDDLETVQAALPAYLLLLDSMLRDGSSDPKMLVAASQLNSAFASAFVDDPARAARLSDKSLDYALRALCTSQSALCDIRTLAYDEVQIRVQGSSEKLLDVLYAVGTALTSWIQVHSDDWNAVADLARVRLIMERVLQIDETYDNGGPHLYLGGLDTLLPATLGGQPEEGRRHFEQAIKFSGGRYLMTKVVFAQQYARLVFDKGLHDRLLNEVLQADPVVPGMTFTNTIAQKRARVLLEGSDDYF